MKREEEAASSQNAWKSPHFPMNLSQSKYDSSTSSAATPLLVNFFFRECHSLTDQTVRVGVAKLSGIYHE